MKIINIYLFYHLKQLESTELRNIPHKSHKNIHERSNVFGTRVTLRDESHLFDVFKFTRGHVQQT